MRPNWKIIAGIALGFVVLALFNTLTSQPEGYEAVPNRTTFNSKPSGYRALYLWLKEKNTRVSQWLRDPADLATVGRYIRVLVMVEPELSKPEDLAGILDWVADGHTLVYISGHISWALSRLPITSKSPESLVESWSAARQNKSAIYVTPCQPTAYTAGVRTVAITTEHRLALKPAPTKAAAKRLAENAGGPSKRGIPADYVSYLEDRAGSLLSSFDYGDGRILLVADPDLGANWNVAKEDNGLLLLNLLRAHAGDGYIAFDEYYHGYRETAFTGYLKNSLWVIGFIQLLILAGCFVYSKGKRFARPLPVRIEDRQSSLEYVHAMAHLYLGAQAYNQALTNIYNRFKARLCRKNGLAPTQPPERLAAHAARKGALPTGELSQTLTECEAAISHEQAITPQKALALVRKLREYERALKL